MCAVQSFVVYVDNHNTKENTQKQSNGAEIFSIYGQLNLSVRWHTSINDLLYCNSGFFGHFEKTQPQPVG